MASGRIIHKSFFINESFSQVEFGARLLYVGTIVHADDEGRMKASPKYLKALIFPFDEVIRISSVMAWRDKLSASGLIQLYAAGGQEYLVHPNWKKWQPLRSDRVKNSDCPPPSSGCQLVVKCPPNLTQPNLTEPNLTQPNLTEISSQTERLLTLFTPILKEKIDIYISRVANKNKSKVVTVGRKLTLVTELYNSKQRCNNDQLFGEALEASISRDACCIGYVNAVIKNKKTQRPR